MVPWQSAVDLDRRPRLAVELAVAVVVLLEVAVDAVHALLEVDVLEVDRLLELRGPRRPPPALHRRAGSPSGPACRPPEDPAVAVEVGELGPRELGFSSLTLSRNFRSDHLPRSAEPSGLAAEIAPLSAVSLRSCSGYISSPSVSLSHQVSPLYAHDHVGPGVHGAGDALAGGDRVGELCLMGCPAPPRDRRVPGLRQAQVAVLGVGPGVDGSRSFA